MDWSDETHYMDFSIRCPFISNTIECDDHMCLSNEWSCGDGQCIVSSFHFPFQPIVDGAGCYNFRESNYMCETNVYVPMWTDDYSGSCWDNEFYLKDRYSTLSRYEKCIYLIRCALTNGFRQDCPCGRNDQKPCREVMTSMCGNSLYPYPPPGSIDVLIQTYYNGSHDWHDRTPDTLVFDGSVKCRGYRAVVLKPLLEKSDKRKLLRLSDGVADIFCELNNVYRDYNSSIHFDESCWKNSSLTFNGQPYAFKDVCKRTRRCISQYRIADGYADCGMFDDGDDSNVEDNFTHAKVQRHRFRCSEQQRTALPITSLGDFIPKCTNQYDEYFYGSRVALNEIQCENRQDVGCTILKDYIQNSLFVNSSIHNSFEQEMNSRMPFHQYCDSFWHLNNQIDENPKNCRNWVCYENEYQCATGQCIPMSWLCDGEWDCSDASDEEALVLIQSWSPHNQALQDLENRSSLCYKRYAHQSFSDICNASLEFPCLLNGVDNPLDIKNHRPCISLKQVGDGVKHCHNAYDERNTFHTTAAWQMVGMSMQCADSSIRHATACRGYVPECDEDPLCFYMSKNTSWCSGPTDVVCLNGSCAAGARCNGKSECSYGEDEYWCLLNDGQDFYRQMKEPYISQRPLNLESFPSLAITEFELPLMTAENRNSLDRLTSFVCNRGIAVYKDPSNEACFCSAAYYGKVCHYHSDRISIIVHLDLTTLNRTEIPLLYIKSDLLFHNTIIDHHEFHAIPRFELDTYIKHRFYFTYMSTEDALNDRDERYSNRSDIRNNHPYAVHFDIYALFDDMRIVEWGSWHYPVYFDYLPAHRLALVLRFPAWFGGNNTEQCANQTCWPNSSCKPVLNKNGSFYCSCKHGFYGPRCEKYKTKCDSYCSSGSLCLSDGRGALTNTNNPFCLCSFNRFGPQCNLRRDECLANPCENNGTCHLTYDKSGHYRFVCTCLSEFHGSHCQFRKTPVQIFLNMTAVACVSVVRLYDVINSTRELVIQHQQLVRGFPPSVHYDHGRSLAPTFGILKVYDEDSRHARYFILFIRPNTKTINITSTPEHCPTASSLLPNGKKVFR
ncbi:unnamed protein product [Adineta steineri]|uniref:EGF-like domain-containing protein n=1 Tax=Adineta steineri TaxID=433720 RepID=A0A814QHE3_9BILA|nr:unnamed protein product [Adineta steineri]